MNTMPKWITSVLSFEELEHSAKDALTQGCAVVWGGGGWSDRNAHTVKINDATGREVFHATRKGEWWNAKLLNGAWI